MTVRRTLHKSMQSTQIHPDSTSSTLSLGGKPELRIRPEMDPDPAEPQENFRSGSDIKPGLDSDLPKSLFILLCFIKTPVKRYF